MAIIGTGTLGVVLAACAPEPVLGPPEYLDAQVKQLSEDVFAVGVEARNVDEYAYARCVAANYAKYQQASEFAQFEGNPLRTRFLKSPDGKRVTHSYGVLRFTTEATGKDAPRIVLPVRETLADCERRNIPTSFRAAAG